MKSILLSVPFLFFNMMIAQDTIIPLWPKDNVPNHIPSDEREIREYKDILYVRKVQEPSLEVYLPSERNAIGTAMVIFPGGGYQVLAYDWEGSDIAKYLNGKGIAAMVVKYRLPSDVSQKEKYKVPLMDAQRAMRLVRSKAGDFHIDPKKIGIIGFSAGGHLAATLGTHFEDQGYARSSRYDILAPERARCCLPQNGSSRRRSGRPGPIRSSRGCLARHSGPRITRLLVDFP